MFLLSVRPRFPVFPCSTTRRGCNVSDLEQVVSVFNRRIFLCLALGTMKWYVRTCLDSLWWCMFIQRAVCWGLDSRVAPTFILFVWLCWRLEAADGRQPRPPVSFTFILTPSIPPKFYCNQPLCVYMRAWMCVWPIWTSKMSVCIPTGVWLMCCESCKEGWLGVRRHKEDIRNHSRQEEREEGQERISTRSYSRSFGPGCLINCNNYCKNKTPLAKWLEKSKTYL